MTNYLIIEDEKAAARTLKAMLEQADPNLTLLDTIDSVADAIEWFRSHPIPQLLFVDIHLADGSAFEIFDHIDITCPIIFTTAYDEYALQAFKVNSIDYLLKPISQSEVNKALDKLHRLSRSSTASNLHDERDSKEGDEEEGLECSLREHRKGDLSALLRYIRQAERYRSHFLIPMKGDKLLPLAVRNIAYFYIEEGTVNAVTSEGISYVMSQTLDELTDCLDPHLFFRANRQFLIAKDAVKEITLWFSNRMVVTLHLPTPEKIIVSRQRAGDLKEWFTGGEG